MKRNLNEIDPDFLEVTKGEGIKSKLPVIFLILIVLVILGISGIFLYNKIMDFSLSKSSEITDNKTDEKNTPIKSSSNKNNTKNNNKYKEIIDATKKYSCVNDYKLEGTKCVYTSTMKASVKYSCANGELVGNNCVTVTKEYADLISLCYNSNTKEYYECEHSVPQKAGCPDGYALIQDGNKSTCMKENYHNTPATPNYSCSSGYTLSGTTCIKKTSINASYEYVCPKGYTISGSKCVK